MSRPGTFPAGFPALILPFGGKELRTSLQKSFTHSHLCHKVEARGVLRTDRIMQSSAVRFGKTFTLGAKWTAGNF